MTTRPKYVLPTPGDWYDDLRLIEPAARPIPQRRSRKLAVARRSRDALAPWGGYFYWCHECDYCNLLNEGKTARCPRHRKAAATNRKRDYRAKPPHGGTAGSPPPGEPLPNPQLVDLWAAAEALRRAQYQHEVALREGRPQRVADATRDLNQAIRALLQVVRRFPRPAQPRKPAR